MSAAEQQPPAVEGNSADEAVPEVQGREGKPTMVRSRSVVAEDIEPTRFEKFIVNRPGCACCTFLWTALFFCMLAGGMFSQEIVVLATQDVWDVLGDPVVMQVNAFKKAKDDAGSTRIEEGEVPQRSKGKDTIYLVYEVQEGSVLSVENLAKIRKMEEAIIGDDMWQEHCLLTYTFNSTNASEAKCKAPDSPLRLMARGQSVQAEQIRQGFGPCGSSPMWDATADLCSQAPFMIGKAPCTSTVYDPITAQTDFDDDRLEHVRCLCCALKPGDAGCDALTSCVDLEEDQELTCTTNSQRAKEDQAKFTFGEDVSCVDGTTKRTRSLYDLGFPLPGYTNTDSEDDNKKMSETLEEWTTGPLFTKLFEVMAEVSDDNFKVYLSGSGIDEKFFLTTLQADLLFAVGALLIVFLWLWFGTNSAFLASCGMTEIVLSVPLSMFMWGVFQAKFLTFFTLCIIFLILGIGADDIFVLFDAYQQADHHFKDMPDTGDLEAKKFAYALRRARCAMSVTSATTFFSMLAAGFTPIPSISSFGIFGAMVILFDFIMVITFFASAMVVFQKKFKNLGGPCSFLTTRCGKCSGEAEEGDTLRAPERFFRDKWSPIIHKFKIPIGALWAVVVAAFTVIFVTQLRLTTEAPQFFNDEYGSRWFELMTESDGFTSTSEWFKVPVRVVLGIEKDEALDRSGTNPRDPEDLGKPVFNAGNIEQLNTPAGQLSLWNMCEEARSGSFKRVDKDDDCTSELKGFVDLATPQQAAAAQALGLSEPGPLVRIENGACQIGAVCFIDWVREYRIGNGATESNWTAVEDLQTTLASAAFSGPSGDAPEAQVFQCGQCCQVYGWYICKMRFIRTAYGMQDFNSWLRMSNFYMSDGKLQWAYVSVNSTLPVSALPLAEIQEHYNDWSGFVDGFVSSVGAYHTADLWSFMILQDTLLRSTIQSIVSCLILAWIILSLATANWIISTLSLVCILCILLVFAGLLPLFGFELGIFESVGMIVVVGLSVDYTVHVCHAYNENRMQTEDRASERVHRTTHAMTEMGISVLSGSATTFLASLFLLPSKFMFYHVFGIFMLTTVVVSTLVSLSLLPALLMLFGPTGTKGDLVVVQKGTDWISAKSGKLCCKRAGSAPEKGGA